MYFRSLWQEVNIDLYIDLSTICMEWQSFREWYDVVYIFYILICLIYFHYKYG